MKKYLFSLAVVLFVNCLLAPLSIATPPTPPCDEKIEDSQFIKDTILSQPIVKQLEQDLHLMDIEVSPCFVNLEAIVSLQYQFPTRYSQFSFAYSGKLFFSYSKKGTVQLLNEVNYKPILPDLDSIIAYFVKKIEEFETNQRVKEFIVKEIRDITFEQSDFTISNCDLKLLDSIPLEGTFFKICSKNNSWIEYAPELHEVRGYLLPNNKQWVAFPEILKAHEIAQTILLKDFPNCQISREKLHSYTTGEACEGGNLCTCVTITIQCKDEGWKDIWIWLSPNGSLEKYQIK